MFISNYSDTILGDCQDQAVSSIYIWSENLSTISEAKMELLTSVPVPFLLFLSYFDLDLKNNTMVLWTDNLFSDTIR
jgi:hypothetical protein